MTDGLPPLPSLPGLDLPPLPTLGPVSRQVPPSGARRRWLPAEVTAIRDETATARTFRLRIRGEAPDRHVPGQHYDVRLTAPDGSTAQRSYSIASAPDRADEVELTVELIPDGEVSPFLHEEIGVGDRVELRGPFGGWFVWRGDTPALLLGGGSGVVPLMAMRRFWHDSGERVPLRLLVSVRRPEDLYYRGEYGSETTVIHTRQAPPGDPRPAGRLSADDLRPLLTGGQIAYVCGSAGFSEHASQLLVSLGMPAADVRIERFGPG
ncbi:FAD-binding oxidoreductase [Kineosporia succinea]|uniref:Ferredoxin-NADP reductase n=1 Tax=Kineosporia succinea TaxID=84632 RepID=A0ABT9P2Q5_9ACTN|nr:FAD-binding oxidoreductase [Kineosporia succinea]MDP9826957.1 ferredoxin-NADP reductase [Kineosporia succinea]